MIGLLTSYQGGIHRYIGDDDTSPDARHDPCNQEHGNVNAARQQRPREDQNSRTKHAACTPPEAVSDGTL